MLYPNEGTYPGAGHRTLVLTAVWIVAPIVVLVMVIVVSRAMISPIDPGLGGRLTGEAIRGNGEPVALAAVTNDIRWDRVCAFRPATHPDRVNARLGFRWDGLLDQRSATLVFVDGSRIDRYTAIASRAIEPPPADGVCYDRADAVLRWRPPG